MKIYERSDNDGMYNFNVQFPEAMILEKEHGRRENFFRTFKTNFTTNLTLY